jgi:branched-chain amino acid transport system substrate-binding protein
MKRITLFNLSIIFLLMVFLPSIVNAGEVVKVGLITSLTGPTAMVFKTLSDVVKPTEDIINQRGGITINGKKYNVSIVTEDDQSSPPGAISAMNKLLQANIKYVISPIHQPNNMAISELCEENKIIRVGPVLLNPDHLPPEQHYQFTTNLLVYNCAPVYDFLKREYPDVKKIAFISPDDPGPVYIRKYAALLAKERGLEVVHEEVYAIPTEDFYPILTKVLAKKPDAIDCVGGVPPWFASITNQARELGFKGPIYSGNGDGCPFLKSLMIKPEYTYDIFEGMPYVLSDKMPTITKDLRTLVEKAGLNFNLDSTMVLHALMPLLEGIETAQSFDTDKVVDAMEGMKDFDTPLGKANWSGKEINGSNHMAKLNKVPLTRLMNGKIEFEWLDR